MNTSRVYILTISISLSITGYFAFGQTKNQDDDRFVSFTVDAKKDAVNLYWKDDKQEIFKSIGTLKSWLETKHKTLLFAMNAGMYKKDNSPLGLYIENRKMIVPLNTNSGNGNFYLSPNGVFYITTDNIPAICKRQNFQRTEKIKYATQSGPMLVIDWQIHPAFKEGSTNLNIRNGVGILPDNKIIFAMSKNEMNFFDFANYFKNLGCKNALYLDGFVSKMYLPSQNWIQTGGNFGVIIGVTLNKK